MNLFSILLLGLAMSTDAFAAAVAKGAGMSRPRWPQALRIGLVFGAVEAITPMVGWMLGTAAARYVESWDHWIAFVLLVGLGLHMIYKARRPGDGPTQPDAHARSGPQLALVLTALATSLDALTVGVSLAFVDINIFAVAVVIGLCTFTMVTLGIMAGRALGSLVGKRAEMAGGVVLILVGATILFEHLGAAAA